MKNPPITLQAREFEERLVDFNKSRYGESCQNKIITNTVHGLMFSITRREKTTDGKKDGFWYYVHQPDAYDPFSNVFGTKDGTCKLGITNPHSLECGFQSELLKACIEDRGKVPKLPMKNRGFDPTKGGQYKWKLQNEAKDARQHCWVIIHLQMHKHDDVVQSLLDLSHLIEAVKNANVGSPFNIVFVDTKGSREAMIARQIEVFEQLFIKKRNDFVRQRDAYKPLIDEIFPDLFFCAGDGHEKLVGLIGKSDVATNNMIRNILRNTGPNSQTTEVSP